MAKLIVIGNGFDLQAKLDSKFDDFFQNNERKKIESWIGNNSMSLENVSFISLLLYNTYYRPTTYRGYGIQTEEINFNKEYQRRLSVDSNKENWMDVEAFLRSLLSEKMIKLFEGLYDDTIKHQRNYFPICDEDGVKSFINKSSVLLRNQNIRNYMEYLHSELGVFESEFAQYLRDLLKEHKRYGEYTDIIMKSLINGHPNGKILNFNYTSVGNFEGYIENNVHGKINDLPIIGIDGEEIDGEAIEFTKTYRKLIRNDSPIILNTIFDEIVIYGHSLGGQDYSYFESVFDFVDLYNGNTVVKFIYSDNFLNSDLEKKKYRNSMTNKLFALIRKYGASLNKDNTNNLLHRLILEGRIKLEKDNFIDNE
ncbi:MAG: hypothetical protein J5691_05675 [Bacilli bacterium]|nr:hypothetical protein [Bacilli bacterium]